MNFNSKTDNICYSLQQGELCYVLSNKPVRPLSSLCVNTQNQMEQKGYRSIVISAAALNLTAANAQSWDVTLLTSIWQGLQPHNMAQLDHWLAVNQHLSSKDRLMQFASELLLTALCEQPTVILIDNFDIFIDASDLVDTLWAWIEHCCDLRDTYLTYHQLSFAIFASTQRARSIGSTRSLSADPCSSALRIKIIANPKPIHAKKPYSWKHRSQPFALAHPLVAH